MISYIGATANYGVTLQTNTLTVEAGGIITADGQGYGPDAGTGSGIDSGSRPRGGVTGALRKGGWKTENGGEGNLLMGKYFSTKSLILRARREAGKIGRGKAGGGGLLN